MIKKILLAAMAVLVLTGCPSDKNEPSPDQNKELKEFKAAYDEGVYIDGKPVFVFNYNLHQISVNPTKMAFRIQTDDQATYLHCELGSIPTVIDGDPITVVASTRGITGFDSGSYSLIWVKRSGAKYWLWNDTSKIGIIVSLE